MVMDVTLVLSRNKHRISRKLVSPNAVRTLYRLHVNGFIAHLVGGCVRDLLLGRTPKDFDIATNARPGQIKRLFRNCRLIGRRFRLAHLHFPDEILEVSTFRRDGLPANNGGGEEADNNPRSRYHMKDEDGMVLVDNVFGTAKEDALRRDFTINALAYNIADFSVIDYSSGLSDLEQRVIRPIGDPHVRFTEDPLRMLRAVRFAASHTFDIEPAAWDTLCQLSPIISRVSQSRIYEEVQKLFLLGSAQPAFSLLEKSGLLAVLFPSFSRWIFKDSSRLRLMHTNLEWFDRLSRSGASPNLSLFLAALFGPHLEEVALSCHHDGIPYLQAVDEACAVLLEEISRTISLPGRVGGRLRAILALQPSLHKMPPRRPASTVNRAEFGDAIAYLRLSGETRKKYRRSLEWWENFLLTAPPPDPSESPTDEAPPKRRRKRRRRHRSNGQTAV
jgi:poly(A) polymerase